MSAVNISRKNFQEEVLNSDKKVLLVLAENSDVLVKSTRNIPGVTTTIATIISTYEVMVNGKLIVLPMEEEKPKAKKPSVLQKLNDMKGMESSTGVKKPHVKEER
mgnify:CR=1 FL=1